jgi:hypothetical protein
MTAKTRLYLVTTVFAVLGGEASVFAEGDVTVIPPPVVTTAPSQNPVTTDGTPVIHKSHHKKKAATGGTASVVGAPSTATAPVASTAHPQLTAPAPARVSSSIGSASIKSAPVSNVPPAVVANPVSRAPAVETGLPVARYPGMGSPIQGVSTYIPMPALVPQTKPVTGTTSHPPDFATIPKSVVPLTSSTAGTYSSPSRATNPPFSFTNFSRKPKNSYPWKTGIITTMFWIGEGPSNISSTDNVGSAWDENWRSTNRGSDNPDARDSYASADHASTVNPFYVALPFNDLAFPDKAREWVPRSWHRPREDGKEVSACKDRWVWIKNANGRSCFAQWEDVGPLRSDHAEYVFGDERPDTYTRAGLDVSPAVAKYLDIDGNKRAITSWRFVDEEDVPPGAWLKYDEQAVIFSAFEQMKNSRQPAFDLPIQRAAEPIDDPSNIESNKKKVDQSKG